MPDIPTTGALCQGQATCVAYLGEQNRAFLIQRDDRRGHSPQA